MIKRISVIAAATICVGIFIAVTRGEPGVTSGHFANADEPAGVTAGKKLYTQRCSSCHGKRLQGQPLWQLQDQYSDRRAPALDESGHMWAHSDEQLFQITKY